MAEQKLYRADVLMRRSDASNLYFQQLADCLRAWRESCQTCSYDTAFHILSAKTVISGVGEYWAVMSPGERRSIIFGLAEATADWHSQIAREMHLILMPGHSPVALIALCLNPSFYDKLRNLLPLHLADFVIFLTRV
jgi:hypothetical protein